MELQVQTKTTPAVLQIDKLSTASCIKLIDDAFNTHYEGINVMKLNYIPVWDSKNLKHEKMNAAQDVGVFKQWQSQTKGYFGFIPFSALLGKQD